MISTTYVPQKSMRCRQHCLLQYISIALVVVICIFISSVSTCNAFQMTTTSKGRASSSVQMPSSRGSTMMSIPTSRLANQSNRIQSSSTARCSSYTSHSCSQSSLFPQRSSSVLSPSRSILQMSSDNNQVDNSDKEETNCPVTKLWLSFRKLLAKFWVSSSFFSRLFAC